MCWEVTVDRIHRTHLCRAGWHVQSRLQKYLRKSNCTGIRGLTASIGSGEYPHPTCLCIESRRIGYDSAFARPRGKPYTDVIQIHQLRTTLVDVQQLGATHR